MAGRCRVGTDSFSLREKGLHARQGVHVDIVIVAVVSGLAIVMHVVLYVLFRRWMDRDLALSFAGDDEAKRDYMRACLQRAKREGVRRRDLPAWLEREAAGYAEPG